MKNLQKGFVNVILIVAVIILAGALGYVTLVKKSAPAAKIITSDVPTQVEKTVNLETVEKLFTPFPSWEGLVLRLPSRAEIRENIVYIDNSEFVFGGASAGLCPQTPGSETGGSVGYSNGVNCTYVDDKTLSNITTLRIWKDSLGIFAINPQGVPASNPFDYFVISKSKPNKVFTENEVTFWKEIISRIK